MNLTERSGFWKFQNPFVFDLCKMNSDTGKWIIVIGALIIRIGVIIYFFHDKLNWIGRLPGDIRVEKENFRFYFPITTLIILSLLITGMVQVIKRLF